MSNVNTAVWLANARRMLANPELAIGQGLDVLEAVLDGTYDIVSPTNPFIHLYEAGAVNASALFLEMEAYNRRQYPSMAMTQDDLYLHMSNADYVDRFAQPASAQFMLYLGLDEIYQKAVDIESTGIAQMTIPKHSKIVVGDVAFTLQYAINIRIMPHGGLSVVFDNSQLSPLQTLTSNVVPSSQVLYNGTRFLKLELTLKQMDIVSQQISTNLSQLVSKTFTFPDNFYYARVYRSTSAGWVEMVTTHTDQVFDPNVPTAVLQVDRQTLTVSIPQIYQTLRMINSELRVDIYTTRGPMEMVLSDYSANQFVATWRDLDLPNGNAYMSAFKSLTTLAQFSDSTVSGGRAAMSLAELRERVITNSLGKPSVPITRVQVGATLANLGYDMVLDIDNVTNRQYIATRSLPAPSDQSTISGAGCTMMTLTNSMATLSGLSTVKDNGNRITLMPSTLYQNLNGLISVVPKVTVDNLKALPVDVRARRINENRYLYSPFHYVLDMTNDLFEHRPYYLEAPSIESKSFITENATTAMSVSVKSYQISRIEEGYLVTLVLQSGTTWKELNDDQVFVQLGYTPYGERNQAYQNGSLAGLTEAGERVYTFVIGTEYDVDGNDNLIVTTFQMFDDTVREYATALTTDFDVYFAANQLQIEGFERSTIDDDMGTNILPSDAIGLMHERLTIKLGEALPGMWAASRSVAGSQDYRRYLSDEAMVYSQNIYQRDPVTGAIEYTTDPDTGEISWVILHAKGDPVLNDQGEVVMQHYAGDVVLDADGNPVVESTRQMLRQIDLFLVDGAYWFSDDLPTVQYRDSIPATVVGWLGTDIASVQSSLLEKTSLFFYPKSTMGNINAKVMEDKTVSMEAAQTFSVTYYLSATAFRDAALRTALTTTAIEVIHEQLQNPVVTMSAIISALRNRVTGDTIGVNVSGLGGIENYEAVTLVDNSARLSIRKKAVAKADGTIGVQDDVSVAFIQHTAT
ncbi:hypothetical protein LUCX_104 [Xanthomonas phage vB_XciM_LucasX]|nr:hypothetical protein LUCX_104 [Xanthomonas phage vB_XciM_LucasX]